MSNVGVPLELTLTDYRIGTASHQPGQLLHRKMKVQFDLLERTLYILACLDLSPDMFEFELLHDQT